LIQSAHNIHIDVGEEIIHVLPQSYIVDNETGVKNPVGMTGKRLEANFHVVIGQVASTRNLEKCVNRVGLTIHDLILEPLASAEAVLTDDEKEAGVALVDIGGGTTDVAVYYDGIIRHTAVIPFGGYVVTRDIKEGCAILERQAELLKVEYGSALGDIAPEEKVVTIPGIAGREPKEISFKSLAYIIQSRVEEIIDAVCFEIENSECMDKLSAGIVLTGGGAMLRHLPQLVKYRTGFDVRIGLPNEYLVGDTDDELIQPMYSTAVGLLLKGYDYLVEHQIEGQEAPGSKPIEPVVILDEEEITSPVGNFQDEGRPGSRGASLFSTLKKTISEIFDETGSKM
jgi:cell division protein FtsA